MFIVEECALLGRVGALLGCEQVVADVWCSTVCVQRAVWWFSHAKSIDLLR